METNALSRLHYRFLQPNAGKAFQCTWYADFVVFRRNVPLVQQFIRGKNVFELSKMKLNSRSVRCSFLLLSI